MIVACPSCEKRFDADDELAGGPGLPLCDDCSTAVRVPSRVRTASSPRIPVTKAETPRPPVPRPAPPSPARRPMPSAPDDPPRRKRPRAPDINFGPRRAPDGDAPPPGGQTPVPPSAPAPNLDELDFELVASDPRPAPVRAASPPPAAPAPVVAIDALASPGERLSLGEIAPRSSGGPTVLDGGFDPLSGDAEPVSLHDIGVVLAPMPSPPPWSGSSRPPPGPKPEKASPPTPVPAPDKPKIRAVYAPPPKRVGSSPDLAAPAAPKETAKKAEAVKPSFFQVDTKPAPTAKAPVEEDEKPRNSGHEDLKRLIASNDARGKKRADADLLTLRGALFTEAPKPAPLPQDLAALLSPPEEAPPPPAPKPPAAPPRPPRPAPPVETRVEAAPVVAPAPPPEPAPPEPVLAPVLAPVARTAPVGLVTLPAPPEPPPPPRAREAYKSGAPGPVVSERRPAVAAAVRRSGIASAAVVVASVTAVVLVVALRFGAGPSADSGGNDVAPKVVTPVTMGDPQRVPQTPPPAVTAPTAPAGDPSERAPSPPLSPAPVEPARTAIEHPVTTTAPSPRPPATVAAAPPPAPRPVATVAPAPPEPKIRPAPDPGGESTAEFDRASARAALATAAGAAAGCKQPDDPSGVAKVSVTFSPSGRVSSAQVRGAPFQGTRTGACIALSFRSAKVPPFGGDPVAVSKDVVIP